MSKRKTLFFLFILFIYCSNQLSHAIEIQENGKLIIPDKSSETIKIDGVLNENVWSKQAISENFKEYYPVYGIPLGYVTKVWLAYDKENLYFAFKSFDPEPNQIKTSLNPRDKVSNDDWVGVIIDSQATRISSIEFYANPNGIQWDGLTTALNSENTDISPDFIYESAGKIVEDGYIIEMRIPLTTLRFKKRDVVKMNLRFVRNVSRLGKRCMYPELKAGQSVFNDTLSVVYKNLKRSLNLEVLPNFTYSYDKERKDESSWNKGTHNTNVGASLKYGITSSITAEATINPDFSQVESDEFQVEVNERYPLIYLEKRPFFMEGLGAFDFGYIQRGLMSTSLYTRYIADPTWATKVSGTTGNMLFGVLAAGDKAPGQSLDDGFVLPEGKKSFWGMARAKYNLGSDNALGFLYSGRYSEGNNNTVFGADLQYRFLKRARFYFSYLHTGTKYEYKEKTDIGSGLNAMVEYNTKHLNSWLTYERYDDDFMMYSAFLTRKNVSKVNSYFGPNLTPSLKFAPWIKRVQVYVRYSQMYDYETKLVDTSFGTGFNFYFTKSGFFKIVLRDEKEAWMGIPLKYTYFYFSGYYHPLKWLYLEAAYNPGEKIFYSYTDPYVGSGRFLQFKSTVQAGENLSMSLEWMNTLLNRNQNGKKSQTYLCNIVNAFSAYQFNKYFFLRGALRYNDYTKVMLTDFLASFTLIPGTVMQLGYGSLYQSLLWQNNGWNPSDGSLLNMKNTFFFKVSYLWQIK